MIVLQVISILTLFLICSAEVVVHQRCGNDARFLKSASACRPYCNQDPEELQQQYCKSRFISGCFCLPGYIRRHIDSVTCIPEDDCQYLPTCRDNQTYKECPNFFPRDCGDLTPRTFLRKCHGGCDCKHGYVRIFNSEESNCVLESECEMYANNEYKYLV